MHRLGRAFLPTHENHVTYTRQKGLASAPHWRQAKGARPRESAGSAAGRGKRGRMRPCFVVCVFGLGGLGEVHSGGRRAASVGSRRGNEFHPRGCPFPCLQINTLTATSDSHPDLRERVGARVLRHVHPPAVVVLVPIIRAAARCWC